LNEKRHGVLFTALTLVLGFALLTTPLAAPRLQSVSNFEAEEAHTLQTAAVTPALESPASITLQAGDPPLFADVKEHTKAKPSNIPGTPGDSWDDLVTSAVLLDVLSSLNNPSGLTRDTSRADDSDYGAVIVPGSVGTYVFTLFNNDIAACDYEFSIKEGPDAPNWAKFPIDYRLKVAGGATSSWMRLGVLKGEVFTGSVPASVSGVPGSQEFELEWKWDFTSSDEQDLTDTQLGVAAEPYRLLLTMRAEACIRLFIELDPNGGDAITPNLIRYDRGMTYGEKQSQYPGKGSVPEPTWDGHTFRFWSLTADGTAELDWDATIPVNGGKVYAIWATDTPSDILITLDPNGGDAITPNQIGYPSVTTYGAKQSQYPGKGSVPVPTWAGHTFRFWSLTADGTAELDWDATIPAAGGRVYAIWATDTPSDILITLDPNGGNAITPNQIGYPSVTTYGAKQSQYPGKGTVAAPTWAGHTFRFWSLTADGTAELDWDATIPSAGGRVYAIWEEDEKPEPGPVIPPWVRAAALAACAVPLFPVIGAVTLLLPALPVLFGGLLALPCLLCLKPCDECTCEDKCQNPDCDCDCCKQDAIGEIEEPPKTGDSSAAMWSALAMLTLSGAAALVLARKRREEEGDQ